MREVCVSTLQCETYCTALVAGSRIASGATPSKPRSTVFVPLSSSNMPAPAVATRTPPAWTHVESAIDAALETGPQYEQRRRAYVGEGWVRRDL